MRIKIVSSGTLTGTRLYDAETGEDLTEVLPCTSITWRVDGGDPLAKGNLTVILTKVEVVAEVEKIKVLDPGIVTEEEKLNWFAQHPVTEDKSGIHATA
jgi:hypothetical protein